MAYTPDQACFDAANAASGGILARDEINAAFQRLSDYKERLKSQGETDGLADKLRSFAEREAERTKIAAALQRRHAALNILARDRLDQHIQKLIKSGLSPRKAILTVFEGTQRNVEGGRVSVGAQRLAYEGRYLGGLMAELQANRPHLVDALRDPRMDADITREMAELRQGGKPGVTGNEDAKYVATVFASYAEMSRTDLNRLGASIGKLEGWSGSQTHDDIKMIAAGKETWIAKVAQKLDIARTFPDVTSPAEIQDALSGIYDTIITGLPNKPTAREKGERVNPANLAKSLGKSRVLHFKDANAALAYRAEFGYGNTVSGIFSHLRNASRMAALMQTFGPNPEVMFGSIVDTMKRNIKESDLPPAEKAKRTASLNAEAGQLKNALDVATGLVSRPVHVTAAKISSDVRAVQSMAKLGAAVFSSISDTITPALAAQFRGSGFLEGFKAQIDGIMRGRPKGDRAEISYLLGEGFDGIIGHIVSPAAAQDGPVGKLSALQEKFFRWNGLSWWTDVQRASAGRMISAEMGMRAKTDFAKLPDNYRHVLGLHGITETKWKAIQQAAKREVVGRTYITPDAMRGLDDATVEPVVAARIAAARATIKVDEAKTPETKAKRDAEFEARRASIIDDGRRELELDVGRFFADETSYGVIEVDAATQRIMTQGNRPGTFGGEAIRFIGQFKGFPFAFTNRVVGRALVGQRAGASALERSAHIGSLIAGMTVAGYVAMTMKDLMRGYWPPRDPSDPKTMAAAFIQGGAAGIYGDFLFSQTNRFGGGVLETVAGPSIGTAADLIETGLKARDSAIGLVTGEEAKLPAAQAISAVAGSTPFLNLFYVRPAVDFLFLNSMREAASPGYLKRQEKKRRTEYGQETLPILGDRRLLN